ncbi:hypothetical protein CDD81_7270 [Ophiocordyceps australis]|uniref:Uncharacterized protein n=1 Tax=Ophiocordyceps australis TaxID=1399860 RepID=A0A2C5Y4X4_9HYPO|nr:hypothetical protein CDD81_7270 [Ophiocordyceps australis]
MSRPPTPINSCPLSHLEIRSSSQTRVYHSAQFAGGLAMTLEAQPSMGSQGDSLMLLVCSGAKRMLSIRLSDLLRETSGITEAVTVDRSHRRLTIKVASQGQQIESTLNNARDFGLLVYALAKSGFVVKDQVPQTNQSFYPGVFSSSLSQEQVPFGQIAVDPRLASMSIPNEGPSKEYARGQDLRPVQDMPHNIPMHTSSWLPRGAAVGHPTPSTHGNWSVHQQQLHVPGQTSFVPPPSLAREAPHLLNPYDMLTKQNSSLHRPRVSSPLRNSFSPRQPSISQYNPGSLPSHSDGTSQPLVGPSDMPVSRSVSSSTLLINHDERNEASVSQAVSRCYSMNSSNHLALGTSEQVNNMPLHRIRRSPESMPRRRQLPFAGHKKRLATQSWTMVKKTSGVSDSQGTQSLLCNDGEQNSTPQKTDEDQATTPTTHGSEDPPRNPPACSTSLREEASSGSTQSSQVVSRWPLLPVMEPLVLVTDSFTMQRLDSMTDALLEQYQMDISRGCDEKLCAQYYLERLHESRYKFWLSKLEEADKADKAEQVLVASV